jgi:hypothetical protein
MRRRALLVLAGSLAALGLAALPLGAQAVPVVYTISDGGVDNGFICTTAAGGCTSSNTLYTYSGPVDLASGTITLDSTAGTVAYSISVAGPIDFASGGNQVDFTGMTYSGTITGVGFNPVSGGTAITWSSQIPTGSAVSGTTAETPGGGGGAFGPLAARMSAGQCFLTTAGDLTCGFILGPGGFTPVSIFGTNRRVVHVMNVTAPEPGSIGLLLMGLAGLGLFARRRL